MQPSSSTVPATSRLDATGIALEPPVERPQAPGRWSRLPVWVRRAIILALLLAAWKAYVSLTGVNELLFSPPEDVARALWDGWSSGRLAEATWTTMTVLGVSMGIGICVAAILTALAQWLTFGRDLLVLLTSMINPLPAIAVLPLAMLWIGLNTKALIFVIANAVTWPIAINLAMGFATVSPTIIAVGRNIGLRGIRMVTDVLAPAALPHAIAGLKTAWAFGWRTIIAAELVFGVAGAKGGLGFFINDARLFLRPPDVLAGLVTIALIGIALDLVFTFVERRTVERWGMKATA